MIPLVDLSIQHRQVAEEIRARWEPVLQRGAFILGPEVEEFEEAFAAFAGIPHCVGVGSGTDALELVLRACDIGRGDQVVLPANTFIATALAVARAGAEPVLVDIQADSYLLDLAQVEKSLGPTTKAVIPVHLFGQLAPVESLAAMVEGTGVLMVEDAAQAQGARRDGAHPGARSAAAATSFYPGKNLGAYGDAGAVLTRSPEVAGRLRALRNYGSEQKYEHPALGFNSRLDTLQAVVLSVKLARLARWNEQRREAAARYDSLLRNLAGVTLPVTLPGNEHIWHLYVVRVAERDRVLGAMHDAGIGAGVHYPVPIHLQGAFASLGHRPGDFPVTEAAARSILSLPIFPGITATQQECVVAVLAKAVND